MKKYLAVILAIIMIIPATAIFCSAANVTVLTTTVPGATYTLNIPANQEIPFGAIETNIGNVTVTDSDGFAEGKNLKVTVVYDEFKADGISTTIPFSLAKSCPDAYGTAKHTLGSGASMIFVGKVSGSVNEKTMMRVTVGNMGNSSDVAMSGLLLLIDSEDWSKALAGEYTATITFTCEVVVEQ